MMGMAVTVGIIGISVGLFVLWRWSQKQATSDRLPLMYQSAATVKYSVTSQ